MPARITALMTGASYLDLGRNGGPSSAPSRRLREAMPPHMLRVIRNHRNAAHGKCQRL